MCVCNGVQGQVYDQGQLAALYSQQHLSEHLNVGGLSDSERPAFSLQNLNMQPTWHNPNLAPGSWMP